MSKNRKDLEESLNYFLGEMRKTTDMKKLKVWTSQPEGKIGLDDVIYQVELLPITTGDMTVKGETIPEDIVKMLEGFQYCAERKIIVDSVKKVKNTESILINENIYVKPEATSELVDLENAVFFSKQAVRSICDEVARETLKRVTFVYECISGSKNFLTQQIEKSGGEI